MADLITAFLIPGSRLCLLIGLTVGVCLLCGPQRTRRWGTAWLTTVMVVYWLLSMPVISTGLATRFTGDTGRVRTAADLSDTAAIVVLGAGVETYEADGRHVTIPHGQSALNALEAARLYQLRPVPIVVSGGLADPGRTREPESAVLRALLVDAGIPSEQILLESGSRFTFEQARDVAALLKSRQWRRFVLVTSPGHMPRAADTFRAQSVQPVPAVARFMSERPAPPPRWLPTEESLFVGQIAAYDSLAWVYYWARGRL